MNPTIVKVIAGAVAALVRILYGWATTETPEAFSWLKCARTVAAAVISGVVITLYAEGPTWDVALKVFLGTIGFDEVLAAPTKAARLPENLSALR
jgi:fluoride ion exporter CrcB/FEX